MPSDEGASKERASFLRWQLLAVWYVYCAGCARDVRVSSGSVVDCCKLLGAHLQMAQGHHLQMAHQICVSAGSFS